MDAERCLLSVGETGRGLDRLLLLQQVIGIDRLRQAWEDTQGFDTRRCRLTREVIFWGVLARGLLTDLPIRQVFKQPAGCGPAKLRPTAPACAWPANAWGWLPCVACSTASSACWPRPKRPAPSTRAGG